MLRNLCIIARFVFRTSSSEASGRFIRRLSFRPGHRFKWKRFSSGPEDPGTFHAAVGTVCRWERLELEDKHNTHRQLLRSPGRQRCSAEPNCLALTWKTLTVCMITSSGNPIRPFRGPEASSGILEPAPGKEHPSTWPVTARPPSGTRLLASPDVSDLFTALVCSVEDWSHQHAFAHAVPAARNAFPRTCPGPLNPALFRDLRSLCTLSPREPARPSR